MRPFTDTVVSELAEYRRQHCMAVAVGSHHLPQLIILFGTVLGFFFLFVCLFKFYFIFKLYITVLVLPNIKMVFNNT